MKIKKTKKREKRKSREKKAVETRKKIKRVAGASVQAGCSIALMHATTVANVLCWATDDINQ
jgi:hypothetical protein